MRRTRGEILRRFLRAAVARAVLDLADFADVDFEDLAALEVDGFFEVSVCAGAAVLWSVCGLCEREDAHKEPQARPVTKIRIEVRE